MRYGLFFSDNDLSVLKCCQLYIIANCKARNCSKIEAGVFCKKGVLKNIAKFTLKPLCQSLFLNNVAALKETLAQIFPVNIEKFLRTSFLQNTPGVCLW